MNNTHHRISRRGFARILAGLGAVSGRCMAAESVATLCFDWANGGSSNLGIERRYRADAQVLVLGIPVLRREGVGGGKVLWREFDSGRLLEFAGFSAPERAAGLNRLGLIREIAHASDDASECIYFGLMTSSPEESADDARKALHSSAKEQLYTAIEGRVSNRKIETATARFIAPLSAAGKFHTELVERARRALASAAKVSTAEHGNSGSKTFLQTLAELLARPDAAEGRYLYSGRSYRIRLSRSLDSKATGYFRERGLVGPSTGVLCVHGRVRRETGGKETEFRLWVPCGSDRPLPLRIEYQAKPYLRLYFEAVTT